MDRDGDGKINQSELNRSLNQHGLTKFSQVDGNHDGSVSAKEMSQGLNRAIAAERREIASDRKQFDSKSPDQLRADIRDDGFLHSVKMDGKGIDRIVKDPAALDKLADRLETMHLRGDHDYSKQVAMLRELQETNTGHRTPTRVAPASALQLGM